MTFYNVIKGAGVELIFWRPQKIERVIFRHYAHSHDHHQITISNSAKLKLLPCGSSPAETVTPPSSAPSQVKVSAGRFGHS